MKTQPILLGLTGIPKNYLVKICYFCNHYYSNTRYSNKYSKN